VKDSRNSISRNLWRVAILAAALLCLAIPLLVLFRDAAQETIPDKLAKRARNSDAPRVPPSFRAISNEHFRVSFPPQLAREDAETALRVLDKARAVMAQRLGDDASLEALPRVEAVFYGATGDFTAVTGQPAFVGGSARGAFIELQPLETLRRRGILETTLRHEYAHAVIEALKTAPVPRWLNEGVALEFAGEGAGLSSKANLRELPEAELDGRLAQVSTAAEQEELYAECYRRVAEIKQAKGAAELWRMVRRRLG
jgi:hypothetical protein